MSSYSAPLPPFYWKVPAPEKDHMTENYRRIRQIGAQAQQKRSEPMKAAFIPGVTKNSKYAHVTSRVGEFLRPNPQKVIGGDGSGFRSQSSSSSSTKVLPSRFKSNPNQSEALNKQSGIVGPAGGRRLSRSSADLNADPSSVPKRKDVSVSANGQIVARRHNPEPEVESVYNWKFSDSQNHQHSYYPVIKTPQKPKHAAFQQQLCHRVEYLPCDGICADETIIVDDKSNDSGRSSSSCRTSRGCNTEETRIIEDERRQPGYYRPRSVSLDRLSDAVNGTDDEQIVSKNYDNVDRRVEDFQKPKSKGVFTVNAKNEINHNNNLKPAQKQFFRTNSMANSKLYNNDNSYGDVASNLKPQNDGRKPVVTGSKASGSTIASILRGTSQQNCAGDFPHNLGTVPKYLKQRQAEWKVEEEAKKEIERNAHIPPGHVLLSEAERLETLATLKRNYDDLISDLNRIPIRIDTIRVRDHKIELEKKLTHMEEAMKIFSRPRVFVKMDG